MFIRRISRCGFLKLAAVYALTITRASGNLLSQKYSDELFSEFSGPDGVVNLQELQRLVLSVNGYKSLHQCVGGDCWHDECQVLGRIYDANETTSMSLVLNQSNFEASCPALLHLMMLNCSRNYSQLWPATDEAAEPPSLMEVWGYGFLFMALINSTTLAGLVLLPLRKKAGYDVVLTFLVALAMGCLVGNGIFVLVPEAFEIVHHELYLWKSFAIVSGIYFFYVMEHVMGLVAERGCCSSSSRRKGSTAAARSNSSSDSPISSELSPTHVHLQHHHHHHHHAYHKAELGLELGRKASQSNDDSSAALVDCSVNGGDFVPGNGNIHIVGNGNGVTLVEKPLLVTLDSANSLEVLPQGTNLATPVAKPATIVAYMVLVGHGFHNFIDGMSIGAAFASNKLLGISLALAVICEEIPHGLGDFAILLSAGMSKRKAVLYNFLSGCPCYAGLVVGIKLAEVMHAAPWILGIAGGIFIYIGLADMLPEMKAAEGSSESPLKTFFIQNAGIVCGAAVIAAMASYGKDIQI